ncbi:unnamed protein product [Staurois parvus]|uniref:Secreted protein n=1 Tax=Staurois parvus TaxID=386267 RepID=A0ABN9C9S2_9NEOB|nr:unnamed protein product [Staurois parvus]
MLSLACTAREVFLCSWESACDQHRANQHCPDRGQGFCILLAKTPTSFNQCSAERCIFYYMTSLTADEKRYLSVYIY